MEALERSLKRPPTEKDHDAVMDLLDQYSRLMKEQDLYDEGVIMDTLTPEETARYRELDGMLDDAMGSLANVGGGWREDRYGRKMPSVVVEMPGGAKNLGM